MLSSPDMLLLLLVRTTEEKSQAWQRKCPKLG